jgi:hypothetical protein
VEELRELKANLEQEQFSESDSLNGISSSLRILVIDYGSVGITLGMISQSTRSPSRWFSFCKQKLGGCVKGGMACTFVYCPEVERSMWLSCSYTICESEMSSKTYSWLEERSKSQESLEK